MKLQIVKGTTSKLVQVVAKDSSSTVGAGLTGLAYNTGSLTAYYYREGAGSAVAISLVTMTLGTWASGGFIVVDGTNMPGVYQLGIPDAALATGANSVVIMIKGATNLAPIVLEIQLTDINLHDADFGGMSALHEAHAALGYKVVTDSSANTVKVYDSNGSTLLYTLTGTVAGSVTTWIRS
jgi:hypothetical protein